MLDKHKYTFAFARPIYITKDDWDEEMVSIKQNVLLGKNLSYVLVEDKLYYLDRSARDDNRLRLFVPTALRKRFL